MSRKILVIPNLLKKIFYFFVLFNLPLVLLAQEASIALGPTDIGENQAWTITITVKNERLKSYDDFPDINGFRKRGTSSSSNTQIINGQISSSQSITMTYLPTKQGTFKVSPFKMKVNGKIINSEGTTVKVGPPVQQQRRRDPFRSLFDRDPFDRSGGEPTEFIDIKDDAFLALTTNKKEVFVGEGFTATLSFYVAEENRAPLQFYELGKQLSDVLKKVRPENCWEENFNIENINGESVTIGGKRYTQFKVYQGVFYPLNAEDIIFPSVGLEMIKYKVAKNPSFFGQNRQEDFKTFYSREKMVKVNELPPHPLRDQVAVGDYLLDERVSSEQLQTGQSFSYEFNIYGEGNISGVANPAVDGGENFDFYAPNVTENINRRNNRVTGSKSFSYFGIPKEPGEYKLKEYFNWVFFNPKTGKYDTLSSELAVNVTGESKKNESIQSNDLGSFYDRITFEDNTLSGSGAFEWTKIIANFLILGMLFASAYIFIKK
ncbi:MAG: BatD family protein [Bacteroidota bacterium]